MIRCAMKKTVNTKCLNDFEWNYKNGEERELHNREIDAALATLYSPANAGRLLEELSEILDFKSDLSQCFVKPGYVYM